MPQVKDAAVILSGSIIALEFIKDFETKAQSGAKVTVLYSDGLAIVKLTNDRLAEVSPVPGQQIAWFVRQSPWDIDGKSGMSVQYVRPVDFGDLDALNSVLTASGSKVPAKQ